MARQKCVMSAMLNQLSPRDVLTRFQDIATASKEIVTTDVPAGEVGNLLDLAAKARRLPVASVSFVPPVIETYDPDFDRIRSMVQAGVDRAERADEAYEDRQGRDSQERRDGRAADGATAATGVDEPGHPDAGGAAPPPEAANETDVLADAC
jgi:hypothetical protein